MKISALSIRNFLALESLDMGLSGAPIHIIAGINESGKSSVRDAVQWALTGQARGLKTHEAQAAFIKDGAKAAEVTITWGDKEVTSRKKTPKTPASVTGPVPDDQVMMSILADPLTFLSMPDDERRRILFRVIPGLQPRRDEIRARLIVSLKGFTGALTPQMDSDILNLANIGEQKGFKDAETEAITRRRIAKRTRDDAQMEEPETQATIGGVLRILPDIQTADVEAGLSVLTVERDKLQQKRGKVEAQADKLPELEKELAALEANPAEAPDPGEVEKYGKALEINRGILERLQEKVAGMTAGQDPKAFPDICPVYSVECPSSRKVAVKGTKPQDVDPAVLKKTMADLQEQEKEVGLIETDLKVAQDAQAAYDNYYKQGQALADKIAKLKEQQEQIQDTAVIDVQLIAMDVRMAIGYELLDAVRNFWRKKEAAEAAVAKIAEAEKEITLYDALAKALAPDGIPSQLIAEALGPFNERLHFASSYLFPEHESYPLTLTKDLEVQRDILYPCLSKSARYRAGICFQYVLATLAGARLLMIDEADILDPVNRAQLIDFLLAVRQDFDTVLVFATSDHADPSPVPEIRVWWLENGHIEQVNEKKAA
ncbi:MAG: hypothetical protein D4R73_09215 [Deltaproteobacteria bacterium]|nr:MAG: hypothetical protein D4R73_09215 [Deltaproteobacteria bacterium]